MPILKQKLIAPEARTMKIYKAYIPGRDSTLICQPGISHPEVDEWHTTIKTSSAYDGKGETVRYPAPVSIRFVEGAATVDERIGAMLIMAGLAFKKPQPPMESADTGNPPTELARAIMNSKRAIA